MKGRVLPSPVTGSENTFVFPTKGETQEVTGNTTHVVCQPVECGDADVFYSSCSEA